MTSSPRFTPLAPDQVSGATARHLASLGSEIRRAFLLGEEKRRSFPDAKLIDLSLGNPDLEPPAAVTQALARLAAQPALGAHRYMDNAGFLYVRAFLADALSASERVSLSSDDVFLTCGAAGGIQIVMRVVLDPGDEVVLFAPYFSEYVPYATNLQARIVVVPTGADHLPQIEDFERSLSASTRLVMLNSPNNPTGVVWPTSVTNALFEALMRHRARTGKVVHVLSDEPYANLVFGPKPPESLLSAYDALWVVRSHSKDLGLAGERIGYVVWGSALSSPSTLGALRNAARAMGFVNAPALMQRLLPEVFGSRVEVSEYERRVNVFCGTLANGGVPCVRPGGTFFVFPSSPISDDRAFAAELLEAGVLVVPGSGFGKSGFVRCSLTRPLAEIREAAGIYVTTFNKLKK